MYRFFGFCTGTKIPRNRIKEIQKMLFLGICTGPNTLYLDLKNLKVNLVPGTTFKKIFF
jgi:hypothetical protein